MKLKLAKDVLSKRGKWSYLLTMPAFLVFFGYLTVGKGYFANLKTFAAASGLNLVLLSVTFFVQNQVNQSITTRFSDFSLTNRRIFVSLVANAGLSGFFLTIISFIYIRFGLFGSDLTPKTALIIYAVNLIMMILTITIQETFHSLDHWKRYEVNKQKLARENLQGQLQGLKSQVSPHFLFNSLNSLSALISEEPKKAEKFVDQMAKVYRYLLRSNHEDPNAKHTDHLTSLREELLFIDAYYHLLRTRYDDAFRLTIAVDDAFLEDRLPPLTLQLLVENAVKHNVIRQSKPLFVEIFVSGEGSLHVTNNLQLKSNYGQMPLESTKVGLTNIASKYELLKQTFPVLHDPVIKNGPDIFEVVLPLVR